MINFLQSTLEMIEMFSRWLWNHFDEEATEYLLGPNDNISEYDEKMIEILKNKFKSIIIT